jgi:ABC-type sugar transport system permease subunit
VPGDRVDAARTWPRGAVLTATRRPAPQRPWGAITVFVGPALALYLAFAIYPVLVTFYNSVHTLRMDLGMVSEFVGLAHFHEILTADEVFWKSPA